MSHTDSVPRTRTIFVLDMYLYIMYNRCTGIISVQNHMQLGIGASRIQEFQRKVQEEFAKPRDKQIPWLNKIRPPLDTWSDDLHVISVICDPGIILFDL